MIVSSVTIKCFDNETSETILPQLTRLSNELRGIRPPGLIQAMLLRDRAGDAMLLVQWRSRNDIYNFIETEIGREIAEGFVKLLGNRASDFQDYFVTWQADLPETGERPGNCAAQSRSEVSKWL